MKEKWYDNDWVPCIMVVVAFVISYIGNYFYHGGHVVW